MPRSERDSEDFTGVLKSDFASLHSSLYRMTATSNESG